MPLALLSGGIDSVVMLHALIKAPYIFGVDPTELVEAVHFDLGLANSPRARECASYQALMLNVPIQYIPIGQIWRKIPSTRRDGTVPTVEETGIEYMTRGASDPYWEKDFDYWDGLQMIMLTRAGIIASSLGLKEIFIAHQMEHEERAENQLPDPIETDVTPLFVELMQTVVDHGGFLKKRAVTFRTPFFDMRMSKREIVQLGQQLGGVDFNATLTCEFSYPACGTCYACKRKERAFA